MKIYYLLVTLLCVKTSWAIQDENPANDHFKSVFKEHLNGDNATLSPDEVKYHYPWHDFTTDEVKDATNQTEARQCPKPHASWHEYKGKYYNLLSHQTCRLPECMETCSLNDATLIFPETMDEFHKIQNLYHDGQPPLILGAYLPFEYPEEQFQGTMRFIPPFGKRVKLEIRIMDGKSIRQDLPQARTLLCYRLQRRLEIDSRSHPDRLWFAVLGDLRI